MLPPPPILSVVVPCYNEEEVVDKTAEVLQCKLLEMIDMEIIDKRSFVCFVDDGSRDNTFIRLKDIKDKSKISILIIRLSRNFGHQNALLCGYNFVVDKCDCAISIDCDLQDDIGVFGEFVDKYRDGFEIVYGVRKSRTKDTFFKKWTAHIFYLLMQFLCSGDKNTRIVSNHADYRLLGKKALNELRKYDEKNLFIRGIVPLLGFKQTQVYYDRAERYAGVSKYPLKKMLAFAWNGITSFSIYPLRIVTFIGCFCLFFAILLSFYAVYIVSFTDNAVPGWASTTIPISFFGGIQIFSIGILGEYIGKIYQEVKNRPKYIIEEIL